MSMKRQNQLTFLAALICACGVTSALAAPPVLVPPQTLSAAASTPAAFARTPEPAAPAAPVNSVAQPKPAVAPVAAKSDGRLTLGDWEDLAEREAFKKRTDTLASGQGNTAMPPLPGGQLPPLQAGAAPQAGAVDAKPAPKRRVSDACEDGVAICYYAVYGMNVEGVGNNYRGWVAVDGRVYPVHKGAHFRNYVVDAISTRELLVTNTKTKKKQIVPYSGDADVAADPSEVQEKPKATGARAQFIPGMPFGTPPTNM